MLNELFYKIIYLNISITFNKYYIIIKKNINIKVYSFIL